MEKKRKIIAWAAVFVSVFFVLFLSKKNDLEQEPASENTIIFNSGVTRVGDDAFGSLREISFEGSNNLDSAEEEQVLGVGGSGMAAAELMVEKAVSEIAMPNPYSISYKYIYDGDVFSIEEEKMDVFKRVKNSELGKAFARQVSNINLDLIGLNSFQDISAENFSFAEDKEYGYSVSFNFSDNSAYIGQNWKKWPDPYQDCRDSNCYESMRLGIDDVPADEDLISISDRFLQDYRVDMSMYGQGEIQDMWRERYYLGAAEGAVSELYIPDTISVIYPLLIDGKSVYNSSGDKSGMYANVNLRYKKVSGAGSLRAQVYESSSYESENNVEKLIAYAEEGGMYKMYSYGDAEKIVEVKLGTPVQGIIEMYSYNQEKRETEEFYIPALIFPVNSISDESVYFYRKAVIVPLVSDVAENMGGGIVRPMPLLEKDVE